jgi:hypothetical protein
MEKNMMLVASEWNSKPSFRTIPMTADCPYVECIFDPESKVFVVISKTKRNTLQMLPKLDEYGQPVSGTKGVKQERHKLEVFQEYYISDVESIKDFVETIAVNKKFDYLSIMNA